MQVDSPTSITPGVRPPRVMTAELVDIFQVDGGLGVEFQQHPSVYWLEPNSAADHALKTVLASRQNPNDELWVQVGLTDGPKSTLRTTIVSASRTSKPPPFDSSMVPFPPPR